jgi:caffeoyl-CoA O-methyltransferase
MSSKYVALTDELNDYVLAHRSNTNDPVLTALRAETKSLGEVSEMAISLYQADFLNFLVKITGVKWAVEVGTFTGTSSISIARGMLTGGKLICFDQDFKWTSIARRYWQKAGVQDRIDLRLGRAGDLLRRFRPPYPLDFVFIDADKESYDIYYEALLPSVRTGGLIVFDNMLRGGQVIDPVNRNEPATRAINLMNRKLATDDRVQSILLPIADGLHLCRKRQPVL